MGTNNQLIFLGSPCPDLTPGMPPHAGFFLRDKAAKLLQNAVVKPMMDPTVYGHGIQIDLSSGKFKPRFANPKTEPPQVIIPGGKCRTKRTLAKKQRLAHVTGRRPFFQINVAHHEHPVWEPAGLYDLLGHALAAEPSDTEDVFVDAMCGPRPPLSPQQARQLFKSKQPAAPILGNSHLAQMKRWLCQGSKLARRLVERAIGTDFEPVFIHELTVDIDAEKGHPEGPAHAIALGDRLVAEVFGPLGITVFRESSRNGGGHYVRFRVRRHPDTTPEEFNEFTGGLTKYLHSFNTTGAPAQVCKVGGGLAFWYANPRFDEAAFDHREEWHSEERLTTGETYLWRKRHAGLYVDGLNQPPVAWTYNSKFEKYELNGGDQITLPLFNLPRDPDGGVARVAGYEAFTKVAAVDESVLRSVLPAAAPQAPRVAATSPEQPVQSEGQATATSRAAANATGSPAPTIIITQDRFAVHAELVSQYGPLRDIDLLLNTSAKQHERYGAAARLVLHRRQGRVDSFEALEEALHLVEIGGATGEIGPATGPRTSEREGHVDRCIEHWEATYDATIKSKRSGELWFVEKNIEELETWIRGRISKARIAQAMRRHPHAQVTYLALALALAYWLKNIHTRQLRSVPVKSIRHALRYHHLPYGGSTVAALGELLKEAEFIRQVYPEGPKRARSYMLHARCPIPAWLEQHCDKIQVWPALVIEATTHQDEPAQIPGRPARPPLPLKTSIRVPLPPGSDDQLPFDPFEEWFEDQIWVLDAAEHAPEHFCCASTARRAG